MYIHTRTNVEGHSDVRLDDLRKNTFHIAPEPLSSFPPEVNSYETQS